MAIKTAVVTATTTAAAVTASDTDDLRGEGYVFQNTGASTVYIGGSDVTAANGFPLAAGASMAIDAASSGDTPYLITASGTTTVAVLRTGA